MMKSEHIGLEEQDLNRLKNIRQNVHQNPEVSGKESATAERVLNHLKELNCFRIKKGLGGHGILAEYDSNKDGPVLMFRAELDALPIEEIGTMSYSSSEKGVGHMCGHDGHLTMLLGLAHLIEQYPPTGGKVYLLFQPAEETGEGAEAILEDPEFSDFTPDYAFALHNLPGYPMHHVIYREGAFTASVISLVVRLNGRTSHAAEPEFGLNPALAIAEILEKSNELTINDPERKDFAVVVPVHMRLGEPTYGTSPGLGEIHFTLRTWNEDHLDKICKELERLSKSAADKNKLEISFEYTDHFRSNHNDTEAVNAVKAAAEDLGLETIQRDYPFKWGEDFGLFTQKFSGAMFGLGSGEHQPALHNPDYDFPDDLIPTGANMFYKIIEHLTK
ncbi:amidohydrolase [bacterium]|nr:amidohydrolase [bacterium]